MKPKFIQIVMGVGGGCHNQISRKEDYFWNPIDIMTKLGCEPELWTHYNPGDKMEEVVKGVRVRRFKGYFSMLWNLFTEKNVKLVHAHLRPYPPALLTPLTFKNCLITPHTYELGSTKLIEKGSLFFLKKFKKIIALTPHERDIYYKNGISKNKVTLMPHSIDYDFFSSKPKKSQEALRKELGIKKDDFVFISVSNFRKFKNMDILTEAFARFHKEVPNSKLLVVGIDQMRNKAYLEQETDRYKAVRHPDEVIKEHGIQDSVIFTGGVDYKRVREFFSVSHVFVNTSDPETMGLSVYEAASAGIPLCLSEIGSFTTVFKDKVLYNKPRDAKKLAENYMKYYKDKKFYEKTSKNLQEYLKQWNYPLFMKKATSMYEELIK